MEPIPLRVIEDSQQQWQEMAREELNQVIESSKALARVVLLRHQGENTTNYLLTTWGGDMNG
ncbi:hypothetical protein BJP36_09775 [Moorena producens JHB]|uniref:Uncharacterized protein n=1 Tax=Moorena producens (strain JHB) TaxID=1454205 RepID=A0A1D9FXS7_MOOP1|nr:hypothetical protein [Moorena producens]AOY80172.2 hypothetical protein BJP36_09775 [Moorena producens JHB]